MILFLLLCYVCTLYKTLTEMHLTALVFSQMNFSIPSVWSFKNILKVLLNIFFTEWVKKMHKYAQLLTMIFSIFKMLVKTYKKITVGKCTVFSQYPKKKVHFYKEI